MKYIKKGKPPKQLKDWMRVNNDVPDAQYGTHGFPKGEVKDALINEQGHLCAYAMVPIVATTSHIEHIKPRTISRAQDALGETWDFENLLACYPGSDPNAVGRNQFGATKKDKTWDEERFVSPLHESCESRFCFTVDGGVSARNEKDAAAFWSIRTLGLDCGVLEEWRRAAIEAFGVSLAAPNPLKRSEAERLRKSIRKRRRDGSFHGYCVAVAHAAEEYIALLDKRAKKRQYAAKGK